MKKKKKIVLTTNKEIYQKFNMLNFSSEVLLKNVKPNQIERIIKNLNDSGSGNLLMEKVGNYVVVKKIGPLHFNIYLMKNKDTKKIYI